MYAVLSYDVGVKRVRKALAVCRKYLRPVHRSVFEGDLTEAELARLKRELAGVIDSRRDSACIWLVADSRFVTRCRIGLVGDEGEII